MRKTYRKLNKTNEFGNVSPYDLGGVHRAMRNVERDRKRSEFIDDAVERLRFEYGTGYLNPYDLGQVGRLKQIVALSKYIK